MTDPESPLGEEAHGTFACPRCGRETPHWCPPRELTPLEMGISWAEVRARSGDTGCEALITDYYEQKRRAEQAERELDEERLKALSSEGQWIEHSEKLAAERDAALRKVEELRGLLREVVEVVAACHNCLSYEAPELADRVDAALGEKP